MPRALRQLISLPAAAADAVALAVAVAHVIALWSAAFYGTNWTEPNWTTASNARGGPGALAEHAQVEQLLLWFCQKAEATFSLCTALKNAVRMHKSQSWILIAAGDESRRLSMESNARLQLAVFGCVEKSQRRILTIFKKAKGFVLVLENTLHKYRYLN